MNIIKKSFYGKAKWFVILGMLIVIFAAILLVLTMMDEPKVKIEEKNIKLTVGETKSMNVKVVEKNKTLPKMKYSSGNEAVATVDKDGNIASKRGGSCVVTAQSPQGQKLKVNITVKAPAEKKVMYLTFDDGPSSAATEDILRTLDKYDAKATFFVIGANAEENYEILKDIVSKGHTIGIHSYSQDYNKIYKTAKSYLDDFNKTEKIVRKAGYDPVYWRFPGGGSNDFVSEKAQREIMKKLHKKGYTEMDWNSNINDGSGIKYKVDELFKHGIRSINTTILTGESPVVLLHDSNMQPKTAETLGKLLKYYKKKGYKFKGLDEYRGPELSFGKN